MIPSVVITSDILYQRYAELLHAIGDLRVYMQGQRVPLHGVDYHLEEGFRLSANIAYPEIDSSGSSFFFHTIEEVLAFIRAFPRPSVHIPKRIEEGAALLSQGKLVAFPTETVYGLGGDATNVEAVKRIFEAKERPTFDPLIVHIANLEQLKGVVLDWDERAQTLAEHFWPGPLTLVVKKDPAIDNLVTANSQTVAVRMPANPIARSLIALSGKPIAAPSANLFGQTSPTTAGHVHEQLAGRIDAIVDGGSCTVGIESTVLSLVSETPTILRPGKIGMKELLPFLPNLALAPQIGMADAPLESPGLLDNHYAPKTPLFLVDDLSQYAHRKDLGILLFEKSTLSFEGEVIFISKTADAAEAARTLYWAMRTLDQKNLTALIAKRLPNEGIGLAINNRLEKAASKHGSVPS
jgi:L-threonylcarbamoyladenylate synthase